MTTYGTIPAESLPSPNLRVILNAREKIESNLGTIKPWREMLRLQSFELPPTFNEIFQRITTNAAYFRYNYVIVILLILFLSLLWYPISLIVFIIMMAAWLFLYFLRDDPLVIYDMVMSDNAVMTFLLMVTIMLLLLTNVSDNIIISLFIGVMVVVVHGAFRNTDDLVLIEDEGFGSVGVLRSRNNTGVVHLKNAASSSFSAPTRV
ncbi:PRA1 family protein F3 isoform X1 [Mercurialis annua]|uniref:PRA1 family protein F3 isoform X1 n=1 Tax=Mercurialis annua TaxID=3986 RepID=UPI00215DE23E|nr:PRA1 family protein F3 isoform X1 [Mercurialis annua]